MALFSYSSLNNISVDITEEYDFLKEYNILNESSHISLDSIKSYDSFDIFLSHSYQDREIIPHLKKKLESFGFTVYVDWINDKLLSRESVDKKTAEILQKRMKQSKCLLYATSSNQKNSRWMPWELGYFDGIKDKMVAILPIKKDNSFSENFQGEEYLGLYYYIDATDTLLWVNERQSKYVKFQDWLNGKKPTTGS